ncbi:MAG: PIN domain-containing protein [Acidobacteria bacterium]|nr:PIN domain-containing protein [Acidobacteriota bacterium]
MSTDILRAAAELRAKHNLKTPDAIHAATAITSGCQHLIANDNGFRRITTIDVIILDDLI